MHGYDHPWAGGAGKNKLPLTLANLKALNTGGIWSGNTYTFQGLTFKVDTDNADNVTDITVNDKSNALTEFYIYRDLDNSCPFINGILNGCTGGTGDTYMIRLSDLTTTSANCLNGDTAIDITASGKWACQIHIKAGVTLSNKVFYPMIRLSTESDATYAPYTNICPISGRTGTTVSTRNEDNTETASATISFGQTVYGGQVDFKTGNVTVEWGYIASYNGESLPGAWISDRDVYAAGATPTTDAEVCYELATPTTLSLTPDILTMLKNNNSVSGDGVITITALTGDSWS